MLLTTASADPRSYLLFLLLLESGIKSRKNSLRSKSRTLIFRNYSAWHLPNSEDVAFPAGVGEE